MIHHLHVFTPETWDAFRTAGANVTGFRSKYRKAGLRVAKGDVLLCYLTRLSRWCGALRVESELYEDATPIYSDPDPYSQRFRVKPIVLLAPEYAIPIRDDQIWNALSMTRDRDRSKAEWTVFFRTSLNRFDDADANHLMSSLLGQRDRMVHFELTETDRRRLSRVGRVRTPEGVVEVEVPDETVLEPPVAEEKPETTRQQSLEMQANVAQVGATMGYQIWVPRNDKKNVQQIVPGSLRTTFLDALPLNYDDVTIKTIEQIDVIWLKRRAILRAFEIEHTTAIYSGLLRMADLLALQPNMDIRLHIVAPDGRREQVLREIRRPVFSLFDRRPLHEQCTYLSYEAVSDLAVNPSLAHINDTIIDEIDELAVV